MGMWHFPMQGQNVVVLTQTQVIVQNGYTQTVVVTTTSTNAVASSSSAFASSTALPSEFCQFSFTGLDILNEAGAGQTVTGQLVSNRPFAMATVTNNLVGEPSSPIVATGKADIHGGWYGFSEPFPNPGVYQIKSHIETPEGIFQCPTVPLTVHGLLITTPSSVSSGSPFQIDVHSDTPTTGIEVQYRNVNDAAWITMTTQTTNLGGHYSTLYSLPTMGNYLFRAYNRNTGALSNEAAIFAGL
jgi:hypothetical protein